MKHPLFNEEVKELKDLDNIWIFNNTHINYIKTDIQDKLIKIMDINDFIFISNYKNSCFIYHYKDFGPPTYTYEPNKKFEEKIIKYKNRHDIDNSTVIIKFSTEEHMILAKLVLNI